MNGVNLLAVPGCGASAGAVSFLNRSNGNIVSVFHTASGVCTQPVFADNNLLVPTPHQRIDRAAPMIPGRRATQRGLIAAVLLGAAVILVPVADRPPHRGRARDRRRHHRARPTGRSTCMTPGTPRWTPPTPRSRPPTPAASRAAWSWTPPVVSGRPDPTLLGKSDRRGRADLSGDPQRMAVRAEPGDRPAGLGRRHGLSR